MRTGVRQSGVFLFNIIPVYRPGMSRVFDYSRYKYGAASLPSSAQRILQNTFFRDMEDQCGDCLADLDLLYVFANDGGELFATINWKNPNAFDTVLANNPTFTENVGFAGDGVGAYLDTQWDPSNNGVNFTLNEGGFFTHINNVLTASSLQYLGTRGNGAGSTNGQISINPKTTLGFIGYGVNRPATITLSTDTNGFFHGKRTASNSQALFKNGTQLGSADTTATTSLSERDLYLLAFNDNATPSLFTAAQLSCFGIGASLTGKESALYTAWNTYFTSL